MFPKLLEQNQFLNVLGAGCPSHEKARRKAEKTNQMEEGKTAAGLLFARLRESLLISGGIRGNEGGGINDPDAQTAPEIFAGDSSFRLTRDGAVNLLQRLHRQLSPSGAIGAILVGRGFAAEQATGALSLANGFAAGTARLGHLPEEGPEDQMQIPASVAGEGLVLALSQQIGADPAAEDGLQLMELSAGGGAEATVLGGETASPKRKIWRYHKTAHRLS